MSAGILGNSDFLEYPFARGQVNVKALIKYRKAHIYSHLKQIRLKNG